MRRVVVTGLGMISPLGNDVATSWAKVLAGESAAAPIGQFDARGWPVEIACEVKGFRCSEEAYEKNHAPYLTRPTEFGLQAALEAMQSSQASGIDPYRLGVAMGTGIGAIRPQEILELLKSYQIRKDFPQVAAHIEANTPEVSFIEKNHPDKLTDILAERWDARAFATTFSTACSASAQAIGYAYRQIQRDRADVVLAGGSDSLSGELLFAGFCMLGVLSDSEGDPKAAARPFDKARNGFVASEGGAVLVLEELDHARGRGVPILAELVGYGESENAYRITDLPEDGHGAVAAMHSALADARLEPTDVGYVNAHGTGTTQNDAVEALAIRKTFYDRGAKPLVSSTKSETGHLVAAAGSIESAFTILGLRDQKFPPNRNLKDPLDTSGIHFIKEEAQSAAVSYALTNSFGFGGTNASLIYSRGPDAT